MVAPALVRLAAPALVRPAAPALVRPAAPALVRLVEEVVEMAEQGHFERH